MQVHFGATINNIHRTQIRTIDKVILNFSSLDPHAELKEKYLHLLLGKEFSPDVNITVGCSDLSPNKKIEIKINDRFLFDLKGNEIVFPDTQGIQNFFSLKPIIVDALLAALYHLIPDDKLDTIVPRFPYSPKDFIEKNVDSGYLETNKPPESLFPEF